MVIIIMNNRFTLFEIGKTYYALLASLLFGE